MALPFNKELKEFARTSRTCRRRKAPEGESLGAALADRKSSLGR